MPYYLEIHLEDGTKLRSPKITPNQPNQDYDDIKVSYHIQKFMVAILKQKDVKRCEALFEES